MARATEVIDPDVRGLGETQTASIDHGKEGLGTEIVLASNDDQSSDFFRAQDPGQSGLAFGTFDTAEVGARVESEELAVESVNGVDSDVDGRSGVFAFGDEMIEPVVNLVGGEQVWRPVTELGQIDDEAGVGVDGALREIAKGEELNEFLS